VTWPVVDVTSRSELAALDDAEERCRSAFATVSEEAHRLRRLLDDTLMLAGSPEPHDRARATLRELASEGEQAVQRIRALAAEVDRLEEEWTAEHRYTDEALDVLIGQLEATLRTEPRAGARAWLETLFDAADAGEEDAAARIGGAALPWPDELRAGAERLREAFAQWRDAGPLPALGPIEELAGGQLGGWDGDGDGVLTPELRSRAHRFAAWTALRGSADLEKVREHIDEAVRLFSLGGRMYAERAAFHLFVGDFARAVTDAQRAIELTPREPFGHLALGIWAELTGKFSAADELYRRGLERMTAAAVAQVRERTALVDPPGRLLKAAAAALLEAGRAERADALAKEALLSGVRGPEAHPEAEVYVIRRRALERLDERPEAAQAAMHAGRLCILNGDVECAIEELGHAIELNGTADASWLLADALLTKSYPLAAKEPDQDLVARARSAWEDGSRRAGPPSGASAWAYVTRAIVSDLESQRPEADRRSGLFEALMYVEKALVHNHTDAQRWGYLAQFLRYLGLEQLAFEAAESGYQLASTDRQVLVERLPLLANRSEFDEAETVAEQLVAMYGEDPWVSAVRAWLALHHRHDWKRTIELLELPIAQGNDPAWYREMEALAYLGLRSAKDARAAYRKLIEAPPIDGNTKCRLARASLALGKRGNAKGWLEDARDDPTTPQSAYLATRALQALANDDVKAAARSLEQAVGVATSIVEVDAVAFETTLAMRALGLGEWSAARKRALHAEMEHAVAGRKERLERNPPTADTELGAALAEVGEGTLDVRATALLALAARRDAAAGHADRARERYERLRGSPFEPEALIALGVIT
jgi:tetratricopeptide (TPR) repeat protein